MSASLAPSAHARAKLLSASDRMAAI